MKTRILYSLALLLLAAAPALAQNNLSREPGYVDFGPIQQLFQEEATIEVNLTGTLLRLAAVAVEDEEPGVQQLIRSIKGVVVRGYPLPSGRADRDRISQRIRNIGQTLTGGGWQTVVRVREGEEDVHVLVRDTGSRLEGMMVMVMDPSEDQVIFVNLVGVIDPEHLEDVVRMGRRFGGRY